MRAERGRRSTRSPVLIFMAKRFGKMNSAGLIVAAGFALTGCAGLNVNPVTDDSQANGIRYYEPAHFLLVYADAAGSVKTEIIVLPDTTRKMVAKPHTLLAKNKQTLTFSDGMLKQSEQEADSTAVPSAVVTALKVALQSGITKGLFNAGDTTEARRLTLAAPKLYKITVEGDSVVLVGSGSGERINLPLAL